MPEQTYQTGDVFGISRDLPLNYIARPSADNSLIDNLTRDKHLVIYGSSKQGKTSLRKHCLQESDYITVHCSNRWSLAELHAAVLKKAGYEVTQSTTKTVSGRNKIHAAIKAAFLGNEASGGAESERQKSEAVTNAPLELDPQDVNDIIVALRKIDFSRYIVLEDFHYLSIETQKDFAVALKAFHEESPFCFLIVGVWLEENRLTVYNGDLTGRIVSINADKWNSDELREVIRIGEALLNVAFDNTFKDSVLHESFDSVYIVQEACYQCCIQEGVYQTQEEIKEVGKNVDAKSIIKTVVNQQTGRFNSFITQFADGFQDTQLQMYRWLLYPVLTSPINKLEEGMRLAEIRRIVQAHHPEGRSLNAGNLTQALQSCASLQVKKEIKPIILDYDQTNLRLNVVDRGFLIWLNNQNQDELLELAGIGTDT
ncbi:MAG TPA: hypothetical protein VEY11_16780 [Pyrinomonadaceae bacterium]|nr:hypothetical protein [Pyrinomonadaceae bacterium]